MNKKFCSKCTGSTLYEDKLPKVCCECGEPFAGTVLARITPSFETEEPKERPKQRPVQKEYRPQASRLKAKNVIVNDDDEDYEEPEDDDYFPDDFEVPDIELDESKISGWKRQPTKLETIAFDKGPKESIERSGLKKMNEKQLKEHLSEEIGLNGQNRRQNSTEIKGF